MSDSLLIQAARLTALLGTALLVFSAIGGVLLASKTAQKIPFLRGKTFKYHRLISLTGTALLVLHPIPLWLARATTSVTLPAIFVPFITAKQPVWIGFGTLALWTLVAVAVSSVLIRRMPHPNWRALHYLSYVFLVFAFVHSIPISNQFTEANPPINLHDLEKYALLLAASVGLLFPIWRAIRAAPNRLEREQKRARQAVRQAVRQPRLKAAPVQINAER